MTDNTNVQSDVSPHLRETYLRKRDISSFSRRFTEIGIEPQFIQARSGSYYWRRNANRAMSVMWSTTSSNISSRQTDTLSRKNCSPITNEKKTQQAMPLFINGIVLNCHAQIRTCSPRPQDYGWTCPNPLSALRVQECRYWTYAEYSKSKAFNGSRTNPFTFKIDIK